MHSVVLYVQYYFSLITNPRRKIRGNTVCHMFLDGGVIVIFAFFIHLYLKTFFSLLYFKCSLNLYLLLIARKKNHLTNDIKIKGRLAGFCILQHK